MSENTSLTQDASFRYANALFNLALETNSAHKFEKDLDKILKILENKNVNFSEFMTLKLDLENTSINCFFGYQDDNRIVLCY